MVSGQEPDIVRRDNPTGRLDSWKEIASYLRRDVRTVQRWQQRASLPVHRHIDAKQRGVFAFRAELDEWSSRFRAETDSAPEQPAPTHPEPNSRLRSSWWLLAGTLAAVVIALAAWVVRQGSPSVSFHERGWLLVTDFDNRSGEEGLDDALQYALERELASSFVSVVPRARVQDALRLMRRPDEGRLTLPLAREVAIRDGDIQSIVAGRVDRAAGAYVLAVELVDPQTGATLRSRTEHVPARQGLLGGVRRLAVWARGALGEQRVTSTPDARLPKVTTRSVKALELFAKAESALARGQKAAARLLLESAVAEDPEFCDRAPEARGRTVQRT